MEQATMQTKNGEADAIMLNQTVSPAPGEKHVFPGIGEIVITQEELSAMNQKGANPIEAFKSLPLRPSISFKEGKHRHGKPTIDAVLGIAGTF